VPAAPDSATDAAAARLRWNSKWNVPAAVAALVLLIAVTALAIGKGRREPQSAQAVAQTPARVLDSASGNVASYASVVPLPEVTTDTTALAATATDWTPPPKRRPKPVEVPKPEPRSAEPTFIFQDEATARRDSAAARASTTPRVDTVFRRDTTVLRPVVPTPRRDSVARVDTLVKRDTMPRR
jgi:hypothetical protein